jgi:hypothetical protein
VEPEFVTSFSVQKIAFPGRSQRQTVFHLIAFVLLISFPSALTAQDLPNKIRGYRVHKKPISINGSLAEETKEPQRVDIRIGNVELSDISLGGVALQFPLQLLSLDQSGKVDLMTFHDVTVNGISVDVPDYTTAFIFKKGVALDLPSPAKIRVPTSQIMKAAWRESQETKPRAYGHC